MHVQIPIKVGSIAATGLQIEIYGVIFANLAQQDRAYAHYLLIKTYSNMRKSIIAFVFSLFVINASNSQIKRKTAKVVKPKKEEAILAKNQESADTLIGTASYYADKFKGQPTASGDVYSHKKLTAACNKLPLGTWIRVTNLKNMRSIIVQINDRLHRKNPRLVDLSLSAAKVLGYIKDGLAHVSVEVLSPELALN